MGPMMRSHITGKKTPGGVHDGMIRSPNPGEAAFSPSLEMPLERSGR